MAKAQQDRFVPFEEVGDGKGVVLRFTFGDHRTLQNLLGPEWFVGAPEHLNRYDIEWLEQYLRVGGKNVKGKSRPITIDEIVEITMSEACTRVLDALFLSVHGDTFVDYQIKIAQAIAEARAKGETLDENPPKDPESFSTSSSEQPSGSDSILPSSMSSLPSAQSSSS